ncbi:MAG: hypothetical protein JST22_04500 [Bacteroidetes bacterium]|nr:hypothetical protein [Bacteroidota bacterium]
MVARPLHSAFVVTQYFHISRSRLALRRFGISPVYSSHPRYAEPRDLFAILRELVGYAAYMVRRYG